jgi:hypothetical protein
MTKLKLVATAIGILAGISAVSAFLVDVRKNTNVSVEALELAKQHRWDRLRPMLVYESVRECGQKGASFDNVRTGFTSRAAAYRSQLPQGDKDLEDAALQVALFDLIVAKVIVPRENGNYVAMDYVNLGYEAGNEAMGLELIMDYTDAEICNAVDQNPGTYNRQSLAQFVGQIVKGRVGRAATRPDFDSVVAGEVAKAFVSGQFTIREGKIYPKDPPTRP